MSEKEKVHCFCIEDAKKHGVGKASLLYNLRFWLDNERAKAIVGKGKGVFKHTNGKDYVWTYNSAREFAEVLPYLRERTLAKWLEELEKDGCIISNKFNKLACDRTKWYTMSEYEIKAQERDTISQNGESKSQNGESITQNGGTIPDINSIINTDKNYILPDGDIYDGSLKEIKKSEDEVNSFSQSERQGVIESSKPSTPEDRKWFKEMFCRVMGCVVYPENSEKYNEETGEWGGEGEERWTTSEPEVVQNMKVKEFMSRNSHEMAKRKLAWFWHYRNSKQGEWITNPTFTIFLAQEPNFSAGECEMVSSEAVLYENHPKMQGWSRSHVDSCEKDMIKDFKGKVEAEENSQLTN